VFAPKPAAPGNAGIKSSAVTVESAVSNDMTTTIIRVRLINASSLKGLLFVSILGATPCEGLGTGYNNIRRGAYRNLIDELHFRLRAVCPATTSKVKDSNDGQGSRAVVDVLFWPLLAS
jgi:hypothetical protein